MNTLHLKTTNFLCNLEKQQGILQNFFEFFFFNWYLVYLFPSSLPWLQRSASAVKIHTLSIMCYLHYTHHSYGEAFPLTIATEERLYHAYHGYIGAPPLHFCGYRGVSSLHFLWLHRSVFSTLTVATEECLPYAHPGYRGASAQSLPWLQRSVSSTLTVATEEHLHDTCLGY